MDLTARLVDSLAWPVAAALLALAIRKPLTAALRERQLGSFEFGPSGVKMSFVDRTLKDVGDVISPLLDDRPAGEPPSIHEGRRQLMEIAGISPNAAVMDAFARVEVALRSLVETNPEERPRSVRELARLATRHYWLSPEVPRALEDLSRIRNSVSHGEGSLNLAQAKEYVNLALGVLVLLNGPPPRRVDE